MPQFANVMEVLQLLDKSNCRKCGEKTCMSFAAAVFLGKMQLSKCPLVPPETHAEYGVQEKRQSVFEEDFIQIVEKLKTGLQSIDFEERAKTIGAEYSNGRIILKIMGKTFCLDKEGNVFTDIHVNSWVLVSVLNYVNNCKGLPLTSNWVPLRELPSGKDWYRLFGQQCEQVLKKTADSYPDLFADLVQMFKGKQLADQFQSDVAVILTPLPLIPMLVCYWKPEDGMESALNLFFDESAEDNIGMDGLYTMGTGIAFMLEKLARQHGAGL